MLQKVGHYTIDVPANLETKLLAFADSTARHIDAKSHSVDVEAFIRTESKQLMKEWEQIAHLRPEVIASHYRLKKSGTEAMKSGALWSVEQTMQTKIRLLLQGHIPGPGGESEAGQTNDTRAVRSAFHKDAEIHTLLPIDKMAQRVSGVVTPPDPRGVTRRKRPVDA